MSNHFLLSLKNILFLTFALYFLCNDGVMAPSMAALAANFKFHIQS